MPKSLEIELPLDKMRFLTELACRKMLYPTQLARMWILNRLEEEAGKARVLEVCEA